MCGFNVVKLFAGISLLSVLLLSTASSTAPEDVTVSSADVDDVVAKEGFMRPAEVGRVLKRGEKPSCELVDACDEAYVDSKRLDSLTARIFRKARQKLQSAFYLFDQFHE